MTATPAAPGTAPGGGAQEAATPGQAARTAWRGHWDIASERGRGKPGWNSLAYEAEAWEVAAEAAITTAIPSRDELFTQLSLDMDEIASLREQLRQAEAERDDYAARLKATDQSWAQVAAERDAAREEAAHLSAALAGDNEGVRLWMLDCGALVDKHRQDRDAARGAIERFVISWADLLTSLPDSYDCHLTCDEANAAEELLQAAGRDGLAATVMEAHAAHDTEEDSHYQGGARAALEATP